MLIERIYDEDLAQASYFIGCQRTGQALVVDARRDIDVYRDMAAKNGMEITAVTETHIHADYLSGTRELAAATGADIHVSGEGGEDWQYEFEAARLRMAQINGCLFCQDWRTERDGERVEDTFDAAVTAWRTTDALDDRARLAAEYAERYALDHHGIDEDLWNRMRAVYEDRELVELTMCLGCWLGFGRLNHVFGLDTACTLPEHT